MVTSEQQAALAEKTRGLQAGDIRAELQYRRTQENETGLGSETLRPPIVKRLDVTPKPLFIKQTPVKRFSTMGLNESIAKKYGIIEWLVSLLLQKHYKDIRK